MSVGTYRETKPLAIKRMSKKLLGPYNKGVVLNEILTMNRLRDAARKSSFSTLLGSFVDRDDYILVLVRQTAVL